MPTSAFVSVREAADLIGGLCTNTIRAEIKAGRLAGIKHGTKQLIWRASVEEWIALKTDEARREQERACGMSYLRHWDHPAALTLPRGKGGRGVQAGREAVALFKGTDTQKRPASSR